MKNASGLLIVMVFLATYSFASDMITMKNGMMFNHKGHQTTKVGDCTLCHEEKPPGMIQGFGKEWAHKYCTDCHEAFNEGPTTCNDCHKKAM